MSANSVSANSGPGYKQYPDHRVETQPAEVRVRVTFNGEVIADSRKAIELKESGHPAVYYLPREDVKVDLLIRSSYRTHCPFKGDASYYSLVNGPANAVWTYEQPYDEVSVIKDRLAFYPNKVDAITTSRE